MTWSKALTGAKKSWSNAWIIAKTILKPEFDTKEKLQHDMVVLVKKFDEIDQLFETRSKKSLWFKLLSSSLSGEAS